MQAAFAFKQRALCRALSLALLSASASSVVMADDAVDLGTVGSAAGASQVISVVAKKGTAAAVAPTQANLSATQPESIISRSFIEESVAPTGNFNTIAAIAPSAATQPSPNGPGLADTKTTLRGFQDAQYNVTWDGIPFGDTNDPSHHSTSYFPAAVIGGVAVERGPGNASNLGQATYGGSINLFSKVPSATRKTELYSSFGNWHTQLEGVAFESGRMADSGATLQLNLQHVESEGYLTYNTMNANNFVVKYQQPIRDRTRLTLFATFNDIKTGLSDSVNGTTLAQAALFGKSYSLNNDPTSQGYYGYNHVHKKTDMEYVRLQSDWGNGIQTDNTLYSYYYDNQTISGADATGYLGTGQPIAAGALANTGSYMGQKLKTGIPGYDKLNHYRVTGDILKATDQFDAGLLRAGIWFDHADTNRHNFAMDVSTNTYPYTDFATKGLKSNQKSSWNQYQPFAEFEWAATNSTTVTPGIKFMSFTRSVDAIFNQGSKVPAHFSETYKATLPFLTVNQALDAENAAYAQFAKGMQVPTLDQLQVATPANVPDPQTTTNYQLGLVHKSDRFIAAADVYYIDFNNMIGSTVVAGQTVFSNQGGAVYKGFEAEATYVLGEGFSAYANGSINRATYKTGNIAGNTGSIAHAPKMTTALGLQYNQGPWNASLIYKVTGQQYAAANEPAAFRIDSYGNADLNVAYSFSDVGNLLKKLKVQLSVFNIADSQKVTDISKGATAALNQYNWQAPRSYMLSLKGMF